MRSQNLQNVSITCTSEFKSWLTSLPHYIFSQFVWIHVMVFGSRTKCICEKKLLHYTSLLIVIYINTDHPLSWCSDQNKYSVCIVVWYFHGGYLTANSFYNCDYNHNNSSYSVNWGAHQRFMVCQFLAWFLSPRWMKMHWHLLTLLK